MAREAIIETAYIIICVAFAKWNAVQIKNDKRILHALNGLLHHACWIAAYFITKNWLLLLLMPVVGRLFFDTALNIFRDISIAYVPKTPKSIVDKVEKAVFGNDGIKPKVLYLIAIITINIIIFIK